MASSSVFPSGISPGCRPSSVSTCRSGYSPAAGRSGRRPCRPDPAVPCRPPPVLPLDGAVPLPIPGDRRAWDGVISTDQWRYGVEIETACRDVRRSFEGSVSRSGTAGSTARIHRPAGDPPNAHPAPRGLRRAGWRLSRGRPSRPRAARGGRRSGRRLSRCRVRGPEPAVPGRAEPSGPSRAEPSLRAGPSRASVPGRAEPPLSVCAPWTKATDRLRTRFRPGRGLAWRATSRRSRRLGASDGPRRTAIPASGATRRALLACRCRFVASHARTAQRFARHATDGPRAKHGE